MYEAKFPNLKKLNLGLNEIHLQGEEIAKNLVKKGVKV